MDQHDDDPPGANESRDPAQARALGREDVDVWILGAPEDADAVRIERCTALLAADELARMARFRFAADRLRYLFAHALVRTTLSRYAPGTPPGRWRFRANVYGRPEIAAEADAPAGGEAPLRFNLSHTAGLVACVVARGRDVGIDVEHLWPPTFDLGIAEDHFARAERAGLEALPAEARRERFFAIWTLKEAYIKARGMGLALPLDRFAFELDGLDARSDAQAEIHVRFEPDMNDDDARWLFARLRPTSAHAHALAVAVRREPGESLRVRLCAPLARPPWTG
jgi:4'-phosphopantetheinyl transferase